ncbi:glycosyltransferase family 2 protein [Candidatus Saccharibacteria bacterium]|nr:glycosyltransferase family 2 protein [Candidatus Saccharibacteria bacterium]
MNRVVSVVVPVFNEEAGIVDFLDEQLLPVVRGLKYEIEVVLVNDGSSDKTLEKINGCKLKNKIDFKLISLARNFGKEIALTAGVNHASGDAVVMIDADGQHPVEMIPRMIEKWEDGAQIVTAVRDENTTKHKLGSKFYYAMMRTFGNKDVVVGAMDFRLIDRGVADEFNKFTERNRLTRGLVDWIGIPQTYIKVKTKDRTSGKPTYSTKKLAALTMDSLASSSRTPLIIFGYIGMFITIISLILGSFILIQQYILGDPLKLDWSGAVAMSVFVSFLVGLVLISQAITALYISQIHTEAKGRPLYIINKRQSMGIDKKKK